MTDAAEQVADIQERARAELSDETIVEGIVRAGTLQQFVDTLTPLVAEARIHCGDHGIRTLCVDPANVASYMPAELSTDAFESFDSPGQVTIGVSLTRLDELLGHANSDDLVHLAVDMETRRMHLHYRNIERSVAMIDPDAIRSEPDRPDLDLPNTITVEGSEFTTAIKASDDVGDHVSIECRPEEEAVRFISEGDTDSSTVTFARDEAIDASVTERTDTLLSLEYLKEFQKPIPDTAEVTLTLGDEFPIMLDYVACDGDLTVHAMQAPRIQTQ
jgi:proliferating cell nuclear antigen